ncbi:DUF1697 domain-containing protein [Sphingomonas piscis]|uniref:DUF1697 domain-containing protein n=1 Tax=Sphingomonas piscis TaxID=2714943 RepID=A0A6G7YNV6_9SPHN|nr:DUF1697 domain-containing protein [Sphingomonas piscis]QIK78422.1 DUF1697 domain-containing protein [Sphingomonas piscis]
MTAFVALLRAVNVGGRKLIMRELKDIAVELGLGSPRTFIASGNLLFTSKDSEAELAARLSAAIGDHIKAEVPALIRSAAEMAQVSRDNPFADHPGSKVLAIFLEQAPAQDALAGVTNVEDELLALGRREIYVAYPSGMARSKMKLPAAKGGTARNMNSVAKMAAMLREME